MRLLLVLFFCTITFAGCKDSAQTSISSIQIDEQATAHAPWKPGEIIANGESDLKSNIGLQNITRKFIGITNDGFFVVQDFYADSGNKLSNPIIVMQQGWASDIQLISSIFTFDGSNTLDGELILWHNNGQKWVEGHYEHGRPQGAWRVWHKNGQKRDEFYFNNGKLQGKAISWYENGAKRLEGGFQDGVEEGLWVYWFDNGQRSEEGSYRRGERVGRWTYWDQSGNKVAESL